MGLHWILPLENSYLPIHTSQFLRSVISTLSMKATPSIGTKRYRSIFILLNTKQNLLVIGMLAQWLLMFIGLYCMEEYSYIHKTVRVTMES
jgi:hypothetical protein